MIAGTGTAIWTARLTGTCILVLIVNTRTHAKAIKVTGWTDENAFVIDVVVILLKSGTFNIIRIILKYFQKVSHSSHSARPGTSSPVSH